MEVSPKSQIAELLRASRTVLILTHQHPDGDAIGSALALAGTLRKMDKEVQIAASGDLPNNCSFLPGYEEIKSELEHGQEVVITIDTRSSGMDLKLGQKKLPESQQVLIVVTGQQGELHPEDITVGRSKPNYDAVVVLDCSVLERLGSLSQQSELFLESSTVNIDHHQANSYFGKLNWVDTGASSTAEMLVSLIESLGRGENLFDQQIATALLTGVITDTGSFQNPNTTSKSLTVAAQLVAAGANQQEIVEKVLRTKPLSTLRLWGKLLGKVQDDNELRFAYSSITQAEIASVGASSKQTAGLIDELLKSAAEMDFVFIMSERDGKTHISFRSISPNIDVARLARQLGGGGHVAAAACEIDGLLSETEETTLNRIREIVRSSSHLVTR